MISTQEGFEDLCVTPSKELLRAEGGCRFISRPAPRRTPITATLTCPRTKLGLPKEWLRGMPVDLYFHVECVVPFFTLFLK